MKRIRSALVGALPAVFLAMAAPAAGAADPPAAGSAAAAITGGSLSFSLRARYEFVAQDGKTEDAAAVTNRTLLGWRTAPLRGFSAYAEAIDVTRIGAQHYNDTPLASARYPTVADPEKTDVNQLYVDYDGLPGTKLRAGRMALKLDNVRYVGNVEFRQFMQVFNGILLENRSLDGVELQYAHFQRVRSVYAQQRQTRTDLFRAAWTFRPDNQLVAFGYFQDQPDTGQATGFADNSNRILGLRANGAWPLEDRMKGLYTAEYARQDHYAGGDARIDAAYWRLGAGVQRDKAFVRLDHERLGSNGGVYGFQTPLGTNHLFQGWADLFLTTPAQGIRDTWLSGSWMWGGVQFLTELHDLRSDAGGLHYGREWDLAASYAFHRRFTGKLEYARFEEGDQLTPVTARRRDTSKVWITAIFNW